MKFANQHQVKDADTSIPARLGAVDRYTAPLMFFASAAFLALLAGLLQNLRGESLFTPETRVFLWWFAALYPLFIAELAYYAFTRNRFWRQHLLFLLIPPLRIGGTDHNRGQLIWLPLLGWARRDHTTRQWLDRAFSAPMIAVALLVLPVLVLQYYWAREAETEYRMIFFIDAATSVIWLAFAFEFIVMISVCDRRMKYCFRNWIDLAVILLPLLAFARVLRLAQLAALTQVGQASRTFRIRGATIKAYRALLTLGIFRVLSGQNVERRYANLQEELANKLVEIEQIHAELAELEIRLRESESCESSAETAVPVPQPSDTTNGQPDAALPNKALPNNPL